MDSGNMIDLIMKHNHRDNVFTSSRQLRDLDIRVRPFLKKSSDMICGACHHQHAVELLKCLF